MGVAVRHLGTKSSSAQFACIYLLKMLQVKYILRGAEKELKSQLVFHIVVLHFNIKQTYSLAVACDLVSSF